MSKSLDNFLKQLNSYDDAVDHDEDMLCKGNVLRSTSPYLNWCFANHGGGLPKGLTLMLYGPAKSGKTLITGSFAAAAQWADPECVVIKVNTEMRGRYQKSTFMGIDKRRFIEWDTNEPNKIFNRWNQEIVPLLNSGLKVGLFIVDSTNGIRGIKGLTADDIDQHLIGDKALTLGTGFEMIMSSMRKFRIPVIITSHVRANIDTKPGQKYAPKEKLAAPYAIKHMAEYFMSIQRGGGEDARKDSHGNDLIDQSKKDARGSGDKTGHKIYFRMEENSLGTHGRAGQFIIDFKKGLVDVEGQVMEMACNVGLFDRGGSWFKSDLFPGGKLNGKAAVAQFFKENPKVMSKFIESVYEMDFRPENTLEIDALKELMGYA